MEKVARYVCEFCMKEFRTEKECREHEKRHITVEAYNPDYPLEGYPYRIQVKFNNGEILYYYPNPQVNLE